MIDEHNRHWWILAGTCVGLFLLMLDSTIVTLALPSIQKDLDSADQQLQWMLNAYLLALAVLVVTAGRLGDMFGRRTIFLAGMALFGLGSVVSATAPSSDALIAGRVLQGVGAASIIVLSLALTSNAFPPAQRARALGIWSGISALALAIGPLVGGLLIDSIGWRFIFWINLPLVLLGMLITRAAAPDDRDPTGGTRIDWPGLATFSVGVTALILPLVQGRQWGWDSPTTIGLLVASVALLAAFWVIEHRVENPIVEFPLFRSGPYFGACASAFTLLTCYWVVMFTQPQYLQNVLGYSPVETGLLILPLTAPMIVISPLAGGLMRRVGARALMTFGMALTLGSMLLFTRIDAHSAYAALLPAFLLFGIALGFVYAPMSTAAMTALSPQKAGIAAGVLAMDRMTAGAVGLAAYGALFAGLQNRRMDELLSAPPEIEVAHDRGELDGLLAGSEQARRMLGELPASVAAEIEQVVREVFSYAMARASWLLVAVAALGLALTWAFVRDDASTQREPERVDPDPAGAAVPHHHWHRWRLHL
ncbi:MAG: MFS transporter [Solirubrobacterales bacterium]